MVHVIGAVRARRHLRPPRTRAVLAVSLAAQLGLPAGPDNPPELRHLVIDAAQFAAIL